MDIENFDNFTKEEHVENLLRLSIVSYCDLIDKEVYYEKKEYGKHKVISWDKATGEYFLAIGGHGFYANPFRIISCS